jgi:hypothetical protein
MSLKSHAEPTINDFVKGKSAVTIALFEYFIRQFKESGEVTIIPAKTMIGIATSRKRVAYVTQLGKNFIHVVFPFDRPYTDNLCFEKVVQVPGDGKQFNHHFRMYQNEDINDEVKNFMKISIESGL